jgi:hypothetical protein
MSPGCVTKDICLNNQELQSAGRDDRVPGDTHGMVGVHGAGAVVGPPHTDLGGSVLVQL